MEGENKNYPYLPEGRAFKFVSAENIFMQTAQKVRDTFSTDKKFPTGAVVVLGGAVIGAAANQSALKDEAFINFHKNIFCVRHFFGVKSGQKYWLCPGCASPRMHSEQLALKDARARAVGSGTDLRGADLYLYGHWWCCKPCWDAMITAGIRDVYLLENSRELWG